VSSFGQRASEYTFTTLVQDSHDLADQSLALSANGTRLTLALLGEVLEKPLCAIRALLTAGRASLIVLLSMMGMGVGVRRE
jgi:hypothetical protein